ncbi:hypothetical protein G4B88_027945 [Cannabis sativa]|uniref:Small ribosomal subunit protein eS4 C-terminal domain-containing protein n=1 Tax=Cannabis sativa TaxID=3483 RepID=A0A7J6I6G7_CANSA|nr:hypothetical protein G4B88_027945 [Cannabis sativa]
MKSDRNLVLVLVNTIVTQTWIVEFRKNGASCAPSLNPADGSTIIASCSEEKHKGTFETIHVKDALGHEFSTRLGNVFTIGTHAHSRSTLVFLFIHGEPLFVGKHYQDTAISDLIIVAQSETSTWKSHIWAGNGVGPVLSFNKVAIEEGKKRMDLCLVGKVIGPRPAYKEGIEKAMKGVWKINHRFQVEELSSKNVFQFFFRSREDRQRISINNVPLACMTELFAKEWGEQISKLEDIKIVNGTMKALDCPLRDFAGDNPNFDSGRFSSWMCAPGSPPRDRYRFNKKRDESPNNRPIMTMGEASRIDSAVERNRDDCIGGDKVMMETVTGSEAAVVDVVPEKKKGKEVAVDIGLTVCGADSPGAICHLCWNAQGLGNPDALTALRAVVRKFSPSLVFLSETKLYGGWAEGIQRQLNFTNSFHVDCVGKSGGLLLLWNDDWEVYVKSYTAGHIDALVKCPGQDF